MFEGEDDCARFKKLDTFASTVLTQAGLEQRIAAALQGETLTSSDLSNLLGETEQTIAQAADEIEEIRERALDPLQFPDPVKARAAIADAEFAAARLKNLLPRLAARHAARYRHEEAAAWIARYDAARPITDALAAELRETYPALVTQLIDLLARAKAADEALHQICNARPMNYHGAARPMVTVEQLARGTAGDYFGNSLSLKEHLRLPRFPELSGQPAYPPFRVPPGVEAAVSSAQAAAPEKGYDKGHYHTLFCINQPAGTYLETGLWSRAADRRRYLLRYQAKEA